MAELSDQVVMVTGGCGFIGSHLAGRLLADGARKVIVLDSMDYGDTSNLVASADPARGRLEVVRFKIGTDPVQRLAGSLKDVDVLVHLAAEKHNQALARSTALLKANIDGALDLFQAAAESGVEQIVFSSSLYAYGRWHAPRMVESEAPLPDTLYGISKLFGEHALRYCARHYGTRYAVLRFFFVYGPRQFAGTGYKSVIVKNFERILQGEAPLICGDGQQSLDYVFVDDVVDAIVGTMQGELSGQLWNVASGSAVSILELTREMIRVAGGDIQPTFGPADATAGTSRAADITKIREQLGWSPRRPLSEGLAETYQWLKSEYQNAQPGHN